MDSLYTNQSIKIIDTRVRSNSKWSITSISGLELTNLHFPAMTGFKVFKQPCGLLVISHPTAPSQQKQYRKPVATFMEYDQFFLMSLVQTFTAKTRLVTFTGLNYPHFLRIYLVKRAFHSQIFFPRTATLWNRLRRGCFPGYYNLNLFKCQSIFIRHILVIFTSYFLFLRTYHTLDSVIL